MKRAAFRCIAVPLAMFVLAGIAAADLGVEWIEVTEPIPFEVRDGHTMVVFDDRMWVIGGGHGIYAPKNDVWASDDGTSWVQVFNPTALVFSNRTNHTSVVYDDKIWIIAGWALPTGEQNDVWWTTDGADWNEVQPPPASSFPVRSNPSSVVLANKIWMIAGNNGQDFRDVWFSMNGTAWARATDSPAFPRITRHASLAFNNRIWITGGNVEDTGPIDDVWYSPSLGGGQPPSEPDGHPTISYTITEPSIDPEGNQIKYTYHWTSDSGDDVTHGPKSDLTDVLVEWDLVQTGETWTVTVTPDDGMLDGPVSTGMVRILDADSGIVEWAVYR